MLRATLSAIQVLLSTASFWSSTVCLAVASLLGLYMEGDGIDDCDLTIDGTNAQHFDNSNVTVLYFCHGHTLGASLSLPENVCSQVQGTEPSDALSLAAP